MLAVRQLQVGFIDEQGLKPVVHGIDLDLQRGEALGLVGESGSGKTSIAMALFGLLPVGGRIIGGSVRFQGQELVGAKQGQLRRLRGQQVGVVFQDPMTALNPYLRVSTQLTEHMRLHLQVSRREARRRAAALLERVEIPVGRMDDYPHRFSGGQRQRILIAAALACEPQLLIADEPTTALDVTIQAEILQLLADLQRERDLALLLITHDLGVVGTVCSSVVVLDQGRVVERGAVDQVFVKPTHACIRQLLAAMPTLPEAAR